MTYFFVFYDYDIINNSLAHGILPDEVKIMRITPTYKDGDKESQENVVHYEVKLFARCSLLISFHSLLVSFCLLFVAC